MGTRTPKSILQLDENRLKQSEGQKMWEKQESFRSTISTSNGTTVNRIASDLGVNEQWLNGEMLAFQNKNIFSIDKSTGAGKKEEIYTWGLPREGEKYLVSFDSTNKYFSLYRYRPSDDNITFIPIPKEALGERLKTYVAENNQIDENTKVQLAALENTISNIDTQTA